MDIGEVARDALHANTARTLAMRESVFVAQLRYGETQSSPAVAATGRECASRSRHSFSSHYGA